MDAVTEKPKEQIGPEKGQLPSSSTEEQQPLKDDSTADTQRDGDDSGSNSGRNGSSSNSDPPQTSQSDRLDRGLSDMRSLGAVVGDLHSSTTQPPGPQKDDAVDSSDDEDSASTEPYAGHKVGLTFSDDESPSASQRGYQSDENVERSKAPSVIAPSTEKRASVTAESSSMTQQEETRPVSLRGKFTYLLFKKGNNSKPIRKALNKRSERWESTKKPLDSTSSLWTANFIWKPTWRKFRNPPRDFAYHASDRRKRQVVNHLRGVEPLCSKDLLYVTLKKYYDALGKDVEDVVPTSIIIDPRDKVPCEEWTGWNEFQESYRSYSQKQLQNLWLLKPSSTNRGVGIEIMNDIHAIQSFLEKKASGASMGLNPTWVLQKYIENPLLIYGRKFDIRVWVAVCDDGNAYIYGPGYLRTSSSIWTMEELEREENRLVHLTNYCAQSKAANFGIFEKGNTLGFDQFAAFLDAFLENPQEVMQAPEEYARGADTSHIPKASPPQASNGMELIWGEDGLWKQMKDIIVHTMKALRVPSVHATSKNGCSEWGFGNKPVQTPQHRFELLGYDFMLDSDMKPWLIEVNTNPSLTYQNRWHKQLVDQMMDELLGLVMDPVFEEKSEDSGDSNQDTSPTSPGIAAGGASPKRSSPKKRSQLSPTRSQSSSFTSHLASPTKDSAAARIAAAKSVGATHLVPEEERAAFAGSEEEEEDPYKTDADNDDNAEDDDRDQVSHKGVDEPSTPVANSNNQQRLAVFCAPERSSLGSSQQRQWAGWKKATNIFKSKPVNSTQQQSNQGISLNKKSTRTQQEAIPAGVLKLSGPSPNADSEANNVVKNNKFDFVKRVSEQAQQRQNMCDQEQTKHDSSVQTAVKESTRVSLNSEWRRQINSEKNNAPVPVAKSKKQDRGSSKSKDLDTQKQQNASVTTSKRSNVPKRSSSHPKTMKPQSQEQTLQSQEQTLVEEQENQNTFMDTSQQKSTGYSKDDGELQLKKPRSRIKPSWNNRSFQLQRQRQQELNDRQTFPLAVTTPDLSIGGSLDSGASSSARGAQKADYSASVSDSAVQNRDGPILMRSSSSNSVNKRRSYSSNGGQDVLDHLVDSSAREQHNYLQRSQQSSSKGPTTSRPSGGDHYTSSSLNGTPSFRQMMGQSVLHSSFAPS